MAAEIVLRCDECGEAFSQAADLDCSPGPLREKAGKNGWICSDDGDFCGEYCRYLNRIDEFAIDP